MIVDSLSMSMPPTTRPVKRVREEREGGMIFEPDTGRAISVDETKLESWRRLAATDPSVVYYATRSWSPTPLEMGCTAAPTRIYLEVTQRCNLRCRMCFRSSGEPAQYELDTATMATLIEQLSLLGVHELRVTGGEPTTRPDLLHLLDIASDAGLYVSVGTNGVMENDMLQSLMNRTIGRYLVSLDGPMDIHDHLRGQGMFTITLQTVDRLVAEGKAIRLNTIISRELVPRLEEFAAICQEHGVQHVALIPPRPTGRAGETGFKLDLPGPCDLDTLAQLLGPVGERCGVSFEFQYDVYCRDHPAQGSDPVLKKVLSCPAGRQAAFISPEGWMHVCGCAAPWLADAARRSLIGAGRVGGMSALRIWQLWQHAEVWRAFRDPEASKDPACLVCRHYGAGCFGSCPIHAFLEHGDFSAPDPLCWVRSRTT